MKKVNKELHDSLRQKVHKVYSEIPVQGIYFNSRGSMEFTYKDSEGNIKKTYLDPMTSAVVINGLVPKSGVLFRGGHGGGKTTLVEKVAVMMTGIPEEEIVAAMIRGNDDQNVNTLLATLRFGKLMTTGEEEVLWRNFVKCYVKIIDEVNRFPPPVQNALFEILNKGRVEFIDQVHSIDDFVAFATENPNDPGTYPLSRPFVDRFGFCVPAPQIPAAADQDLLAERPDDKLFGISVKPILTLEELKEAKKMISSDVKMSADALLFSIYLTQAVSTCERGDNYDKSHNLIPVGERCKGCGFDTENSICKMTLDGVSGRAFLDFQRWGKAYAWFLNAFENPENPEVQIETIQTIAPYLLYHRINPTETVIARDPYNGMKLKFLEHIVKLATHAYNTIADPLKQMPRVLRGEISPQDASMRDIEKDLVVKYHFKPLLEEAGKKEFREIYELIETRDMKDEVLEDINRKLVFATELKPSAQKYLLSKALAKSRKEDHI